MPSQHTTVILTHENADFDAIAALVATARLYPEAMAILPRRVNRNVRHFLTLYGSDLPLHNVRDLAGRGLLQASSGNVPNAVRIELESDFRKAEGDLDRVRQLGEKLRTYGLFREYEDRFYALYKGAK